MSLWQSFRRWQARRALRDDRFDALFDSAPPAEWVSLDCETSSVDPQDAEILSIAAVPVRGDRILSSQALHLTLKPSRPIAVQSIPIHQLRQQDLANGLPVQEALGLLLDFIGPRPLIGYYLEFDLAVINRQLKPWLGIHLPNPAIEISGLYYDRKVTAYRPEVDLRLNAILDDLNLPRLPRHDPVNDALLAAMIFLKLKHGHGPLNQ